MRRSGYVLAFTALFVCIGGLGALCYRLWPSICSVLPVPSSEVIGMTGSAGQLSLLNIAVTVVLFFLLAFSVLNIYSFFNAQMDSEKKELRVSHRSTKKELEALKLKSTSVEEDLRKGYLYERNFQRLFNPFAPIYVRTAAAGFFVENHPRDNDVVVLRALYEKLERDPGSNSTILQQLQDVLAMGQGGHG